MEEKMEVFLVFCLFSEREELKHSDMWHNCTNIFFQALIFYCSWIRWREMFAQLWPLDFSKELGPVLPLSCTHRLLWVLSPKNKPPFYVPTCPKLPAGSCLRAEAWAGKGQKERAARTRWLHSEVMEEHPLECLYNLVVLRLPQHHHAPSATWWWQRDGRSWWCGCGGFPPTMRWWGANVVSQQDLPLPQPGLHLCPPPWRSRTSYLVLSEQAAEGKVWLR